MAQGPEKDMLRQTKLKVQANEKVHERREKMQASGWDSHPD